MFLDVFFLQAERKGTLLEFTHSPLLLSLPYSTGNPSDWNTTTWFKEKHQAWKTYAGVFSCNEKLLPGHTTNNKVGTNYYTQSKQRHLNSWQSFWVLLWFVLYSLLFTFYIYDFGSHQQLCSRRVLGWCMHIFNCNQRPCGDGKGNVSSFLTTQSHHVFSGCHLCCLKWEEWSNFCGCIEEL